MKKYYATFIIVLIFLSLFFYYKKFEQIKRVTPVDNTSEVAFYLPEKEIHKIILKRNKKIIELIKENKKWIITKPGRFAADETPVNALVQELKQFIINRKILENANPKDLEKFGLNKTAVEVEVFTGNKNYKILIGDKTPLENYYIKIENKIYTVPSFRAEKFFKEMKDFRNKKIVEIKKNNLGKIKIGIERKTIELKNFNNVWKVVLPIQKDYPASDLESFLNYMENFQVEDFITEKPISLGMYGLATKINYISFVNKDKSVITLILGKKENNKIYLGITGKNTVYAVGEYLYSRLKEIVNKGIQPEKSVSVKNKK